MSDSEDTACKGQQYKTDYVWDLPGQHRGGSPNCEAEERSRPRSGRKKACRRICRNKEKADPDNNSSVNDQEFTNHFPATDCSRSDCETWEDLENYQWQNQDAPRSVCPTPTSFQRLAAMNANANGTVVSDSSRMKVTEPNLGVDRKTYMRKPGQQKIPMEAVGLSLSDSGMDVYVKVDSEEKKKLLVDANVRLIAKVKDGGKNKNENDSKIPRQRQDLMPAYIPVYCPKQDCTQKKMLFNDIQRTETLPSRSEEQSMETVFAMNKNGTFSRYYEFYKMQPPFYVSSPSAEQQLKKRSTGKNVRPLLDNDDQQFDTEMDVSDNMDHQGHQYMMEFQDAYFREYNQSSNFPRPMINQTHDFLKRHNEQLHGDLQGKKLKQSCPQGHVYSHPDFSQDHLSNDYVPPYGQSELGNRDKGGQMTREFCTQNALRANHEFNCDAANTTATKDALYSKHMSQMLKNNSKTGASETKSEADNENPITLDNIMEYADNIRKKMREDYRDLNNMMKEFCEEVQENNNNKTSESSSDESNKDRKTKMNGETACIVM